VIHPARSLTFDDLHAGLEAARAAGMVVRRFDPATGRALYIYSNKCVYDGGWDAFSLMARGLILAPADKRVVATPFVKFFNAGERNGAIPDLPFETYEKLDGSLAIIHHHAGRWRAATKGAFDSDQARWTEARLAAQDTAALVPGVTYLAETIYPENVIVVRYDESALVLLAAYAEDGSEIGFDELRATADALGWRTPRRHRYDSIADLIADASRLPATEEGFVLRFSDGSRLKLKGAEYRRIHAMISRCTPLGVWESIAAGDDMQAIRRELPEEFWGDFDRIVGLLLGQAAALEARIAAAAAKVAHMSDKELGLALNTAVAPDMRPYLFTWRKSGGKVAGRQREAMWRALRPTGNVLDGYVPSTGLERVTSEDG
jgi:RNA ligase